MAVSYRLEIHYDAIRQILNSSNVASLCHQEAERIARTAGSGFHVTRPYYPGNRVIYRVYGDSDDARIAEADEKVLSTAVSSCRS